MPNTSSTDTPSNELLPLLGRYQAAWSEQCTRIAQRQIIILWYIGAAGAVTSYCYVHPSTEMMYFLLASISLLNIFASLLMWMHNRIIQELTAFMSVCEQCAAKSIIRQGCIRDGKTTDLFYFYSYDLHRGGKNGSRAFHANHRKLHRVVLALIVLIGGTVATWAASVMTAPDGYTPLLPNNSPWVFAAVMVLGISVGILAFDIWKDQGGNRPDLDLREADPFHS